MEKVKFKDAATQAVDVVFEQFKMLLNLPVELELSWVDKECGMADINNGLLVISYADMLEAVRKQIGYGELMDWQDYNANLAEVDLAEYCIPLERWKNYGGRKISSFQMSLIADAKDKYQSAKKEYDKLMAEARRAMV